VNGAGGFGEVGGIVGRGNIAAEKPQQHRQGGCDADNVHRHHHGCIFVEADLEVIRRNDIHQVRHHQRQARRVGDEPRAHDEGQGCRRGKAQGQQHRHHDGREDQRGAVIGKQRRDQCTEQHHVGKQPPTASAPPARHMQCGPGKKTGFVEQQADDDQRDKGAGGVPDDVPHHGDIGQADHTKGQGQDGAHRSAPADPEALGLPDDQDDGEDKNGNCDKHE